jgi:hypothetical protein
MDEMNKATPGRRPPVRHLDSGLTQASFHSAQSHLPGEFQQISPRDRSSADQSNIDGGAGESTAAHSRADSGSTLAGEEEEEGAQDGKQRKQDGAGNSYVETSWDANDPEHPQNWPMSKK